MDPGYAGHVPAVMTVNGDMVFAELCTPAAGGLTVNDFVVAAK
jgi:pterin-4a-carbinolamine dehydratase